MTGLSEFLADVGGQHCPCPVLVLFLSGFSGKSSPVSVRCPDAVRIIEKNYPLSVGPAGPGRDRAVQTFTVLVRRRLVSM